MHPLFGLLTLLSSLLYGAQALAGTVVEFSIVGPGIEEKQTAFIQDGLIYVENAGGLRGSDLLFDAEKSAVVMINHEERTYYTLDEEEVDSLAQLADNVAATMENQKEVLSGILDTFGLGGLLESKPESGTPADKRVEEMGWQMTVSGLRCHIYRIWRKGRLDTELCIAGPDKFPIPKADYRTLESLYRFGDKVFELAGPLLTQLGVPIPMLGSDQLHGLPVFINSFKEGIQTFVERIEAREVDASRFRIPEGYEPTVFPAV